MGTAHGRTALLIGVFAGPYFALLWALGFWPEHLFLRMTAPWALLFPYIVLVGTGQRRNLLAVEVLRPVERGACFREMGLLLGIQMLVAWAGVLASIVIVAMLLIPHHLDWRTVAVMTAVTGLGQAWLWGIGVWLLRYRSLYGVALFGCPCRGGSCNRRIDYHGRAPGGVASVPGRRRGRAGAARHAHCPRCLPPVVAHGLGLMDSGQML
jgi:hypothetical protein